MEKVSKNSVVTRAADRIYYTETPCYPEKDLSPWKFVESTWPHSLPGSTASVPAGITPTQVLLILKQIAKGMRTTSALVGVSIIVIKH